MLAGMQIYAYIIIRLRKILLNYSHRDYENKYFIRENSEWVNHEVFVIRYIHFSNLVFE